MNSPKRRVGRHRIYMNVGYLLTEEQLRNYFAQFGPLLDVYLPKHKSGRNKGFGFTTFENELDLDRALRASEHVIEDVIVKINKAGPRPEYDPMSPTSPESENGPLHHLGLGTSGDASTAARQPCLGEGPRIYVGGVPDDITEEDLRGHFNHWGNVLDIYFPGKRGQKRVNYCFITFDHWRAAQRACNESDRNIRGRALQSISIAEERLAEQRVDARTRVSASAALPPFLPMQLGHLGYNGLHAPNAHPMSLQGLSTSLTGLGLYSQQQDLYNHMLPANNALLDASTAPDPYLNAGLMSNMHAMHAAAALQQAQMNAQMAASMASQMPMTPSLHRDYNLHPAGLGGGEAGGMSGHPTWSWARTKNVSSAPRTVQAAPPSYESTLSAGLRSSLPFNAPGQGTSGTNLGPNGVHHNANPPAWYAAQINGYSGDGRLVNGFHGQPKAEAAALVGHY
ncbi:hypothetical protein WJX73_009458 [Symbiochloris irregularis]|uniref:RRM domain-containing protein n=1 Tax=Symbiochloris irregularis TaxID=706552 RepID=A0AAW1PC07_9CHLO